MFCFRFTWWWRWKQGWYKSDLFSLFPLQLQEQVMSPAHMCPSNSNGIPETSKKEVICLLDPTGHLMQIYISEEIVETGNEQFLGSMWAIEMFDSWNKLTYFKDWGQMNFNQDRHIARPDANSKEINLRHLHSVFAKKNKMQGQQFLHSFIP